MKDVPIAEVYGLDLPRDARFVFAARKDKVGNAFDVCIASKLRGHVDLDLDLHATLDRWVDQRADKDKSVVQHMVGDERKRHAIVRPTYHYIESSRVSAHVA
jgi:hypothetical protein